MREVTRDSKWLNDVKQQINQPSEESKIIIALLMRIYDVQMALLSHASKGDADKLYDAHARGEDFNPQIFIPEITAEVVDE